MNLTTATVRPGDSVATFCIRLPRFQGQASSNMKMLGRPVDITYTSTGAREIPCHVLADVEFYEKTYPFFIRTNQGADNSIEKVDQKLDVHFKEMSKQYPLLQSLPSLHLNSDDDNDLHFVVSLPPRTSLYCSNEFFFRSVGLADNGDIQLTRRDMSAGGKRLVSEKVVTGFFNPSQDQQRQYRGESIPPGSLITAVTFGKTTMPATSHFQVEFLETRHILLQTPPGEERLQPATKENALRLIRLQAERLRQVLNLKANLLEILPGGGETVFIGNRAFLGANMTISLTFNPFMAAAYGWQAGQALVFPLDTARIYDIQVRSQKADPFVGLYPITMRMAGFGSSNSYVDGHGYTAIMAYIKQKGGGDIEMTTVGMLFDSDCTYVTMQFLDKQRNIVSFSDGHMISLLMKFQSL